MTEILQYHLNFRGMSGRVVRFRIMDTDEVEAVEDNGSRAAGEDANEATVRRQQLKLLMATFIVSYSDPGQTPAYLPVLDAAGNQKVINGKPAVSVDRGVADEEKLLGATFHKVENPALLQAKWSSIFGPKETSALNILYRDNHEVNGSELEMLLGKARPVSTGD